MVFTYTDIDRIAFTYNIELEDMINTNWLLQLATGYY
jgi:hypothetical protein